MRRRLAALAALGLGCLLLAGVAPVAGVHDTGEQLVVSIEADGDATVTKVTRYDLSNASERRTFERLEANETARDRRAAAFGDYLARGAAAASEATGRDVAAGDVAVNLTRRNGTGVVRLRGSWANVATVEGGRAALTQPFAGGFPVNRTLVVRGPEGYVRHHTAPAPARALQNAAFWTAETDLSGFRATFADPDAATPTATATPVPDTPTAAPVTTDGLVRLFGAASLAAVPALAFLVAFRREGR